MDCSLSRSFTEATNRGPCLEKGLDAFARADNCMRNCPADSLQVCPVTTMVTLPSMQLLKNP